MSKPPFLTDLEWEDFLNGKTIQVGRFLVNLSKDTSEYAKYYAKHYGKPAYNIHWRVGHFHRNIYVPVTHLSYMLWEIHADTQDIRYGTDCQYLSLSALNEWAYGTPPP